MSNRKINEMPLVEIRESIFELEDMLMKLSSINTPHTNITSDLTECLLCLGNEIKKIKAFLVLD